MEKLEFMYGLVIIMLVVITFLGVHLSKAIGQRDAYRQNALVFEGLLETEKQSTLFYNELYDSAQVEIKRLEENVMFMNDEIAICHGRKTRQSFYVNNK